MTEPQITSLEELFRRAHTYPGAGEAIAGLQTALSHLEEELERASNQIALRLRAKHTALRDEIHPEDKEYDEYALDRTINVLLPRVVRGGFILTLWSSFEVAAHDLARYAYGERGTPLQTDPFRSGNFLKNLDAVFTNGLGISAFPVPDVYRRLDELRGFRRALVHHAGKVEELPPSLWRSTPAEYEAIGLHHYEDLRNRYVVPKAEFVRGALDLVSQYILDLADRVYGVIHPVPLTDA